MVTKNIDTVWRSLLYMPANKPRFIEKAQTLGADGIILDLEDSIASHNKTDARNSARLAITELSRGPSDIIVRINSPLRLAIRDLEDVVRPGLNAIFLPKIENPGLLLALDEVLASLEAEQRMPIGSVRTVPMIETPKALLRSAEIAIATPRNIALILGGEDFAKSANLKPSPETLSPPKLQVALSAKAAGLIPLGILDTVANFSDPDRSLKVALKSADFGFEGATCIHPSMIKILNQAFTPNDFEIEKANLVIQTMEKAWKNDSGAVQINGEMIDLPVYERAKALLSRVATIKKKSQTLVK